MPTEKMSEFLSSLRRENRKKPLVPFNDTIQDDLKHLAELGIIRSIPVHLKDQLTKGRLQNILTRVQDLCDVVIQKYGQRLYLENKDSIQALLDEFGDIVGWKGKEKHIVTYISFIMEFIEHSQFDYNPQMVSLLNDAVDYYERSGNAPQATFWAGGVAFQKWDNLAIDTDGNVFYKSDLH